jgi:hypothetical protein
MTKMPGSEDFELSSLPVADDGPRLQAPPKAVVRAAAITIVALAGFGLFRGIVGSRPSTEAASRLSVLAGLSPAATSAAKPAAPLPSNQEWSTLSGPRMIEAKAKAAPAVKPADSSDEEAAESAAPAAEAAAAAMAPDAPEAPPASAAASSGATAPPPAP